MNFKNKIKKNLKKIKILYKLYHAIKDKKRNKYLLKNGHKYINEVCCKLNQSNINVFCAYGTLLGFIREGSIISHDLDIDMGVIEDENFSWNILDIKMKEIGFKVDHYFEYDNDITEKTYIKENVSIDFFKYKIMNNYMQGYIYFKDENLNYKNEEDFSIKISKVPIVKNILLKEINGINVLIPDNSIEMLETIYGKNWKIPDPSFEHKEEVIKDEYSKLYKLK